jgi:hypothetical protein
VYIGCLLGHSLGGAIDVSYTVEPLVTLSERIWFGVW